MIVIIFNMSIGNHIHKFIDFEIKGGDYLRGARPARERLGSSFIHLKLVFTYGFRFVSGGFFTNDNIL
jgi:hypothetical protein